MTYTPQYVYVPTEREGRFIFEALKMPLGFMDYTPIDDQKDKGKIVETLRVLHDAGYNILHPDLENMARSIMESRAAHSIDEEYMLEQLKLLRSFAERVTKGGRFKLYHKNNLKDNYLQIIQHHLDEEDNVDGSTP